MAAIMGSETTRGTAGIRLGHSVDEDGTFLIEVTAMHEIATAEDNRLWFALGDALAKTTARAAYPEFTRLSASDDTES